MNGHFICDECGQRLGREDSHVVLTDRRVVCMRHYVAHLDAGQVRTVLDRARTIDMLQPVVNRPQGPLRPEPRQPLRGSS